MWLDSCGSGQRRVAGPSVNFRGPENARNVFTEKQLVSQEYSLAWVVPLLKVIGNENKC